MAPRRTKLRRQSLKVNQNADTPLYLFTLTADEILQLADISRVSRSKSGKLLGYQRPEVRRHIQNITEYLDSGSVIFPNSVILALSSKTGFRKARGVKCPDEHTASGILEIPLPKKGQKKPGWIVDGQQRVMALSKSSRTDLPIPVSAFVTDDVEIQRDQFLRINSSKPLPRGLISELLPTVKTTLPKKLAMRRAPSAICDVLNHHDDSPFRGLISRPSLSKEEKRAAVIKDTSIIKMIEDSLTTPSGCLFPYRNIATGETDYASVTHLLLVYWSAVQSVFSDAWGLPARRSRLMHGAGIRSMGRLMDRIMASANLRSSRASANVRRELRKVTPVCRWTEGEWEDLGGVPWNGIQNTPSHIRALSNLLLRCYMSANQG